MTETVEVNGIVLSSMPVGEADRRLLVLTKELGKISCFARGARRPTSALVSATRPFAFGRFFLYSGRESYTLNRAEITEHFEPVVMDVESASYGMYFLELAGRFAQENTDEGPLLTLLYYTLRALTNERFHKRLVMRIFEMKTLTLSGFAPEFQEGEEFAERYGLSKSAVYALNFIERTEIPKLFTFTVTEEVLTEMGRASDDLLARALDRPLKSRSFIDLFS
jgi:DNA repair protein RecO (recombination protein O)